MEQEKVNILSKLREELKSLKATGESVDSVTNAVAAILDRFFNKDSVYKKKIERIISKNNVAISDSLTYPNRALANQVWTESYKKELERLINNMISEIEGFGLPSSQDKKIDKSIKITNTLSQNQEQSQNLNLNIVLEALKNELTGKQFKEIENIIKQEPDAEKARPKIIEKMNSFGKDLLSNILANLLTNPSVWNLFF